MRRNPEPLTKREANRVATTSPRLFAAFEEGKRVTFTYTKPNGDRSERAGVPMQMLGTDDTLSVLVDTDAGYRTFNVGSITNLRVHDA